ncbi:MULTISPECIES: hypothetical protein [Pseudanabaena]|uniref:Uncharacterized protein n=2 Tax=Pseudanabaena TaxID=1152 RepID=L8MXB6_9CYAN|nr:MULTISPECIES: hypothetical protein [Pseudanabaena]ELS31444.1 hypothetical protein Pse7429DRAFT_3475 [Pseudanabaena biceps PCC 7429]MDG3496303.1 hypothetical protein [Pseudanabaena catenata USMAC16]
MSSESRQYIEVAASLEQRKAMAVLAKEFTKKVADKTYKPIFEEWSRNYLMQENNRVGYKAKYCSIDQEMDKEIKDAIEYLKNWIPQNFKPSKSEQDLKTQNQIVKKILNSSTNMIIKICTRERILVYYKHLNPQEGETLINKLISSNRYSNDVDIDEIYEYKALILQWAQKKIDIKNFN